MSKSAFFGSNLTHKSYLQILTSKMHILAQKNFFVELELLLICVIDIHIVFAVKEEVLCLITEKNLQK